MRNVIPLIASSCFAFLSCQQERTCPSSGDYVHITIINNSGQPIRHIQVKAKTVIQVESTAIDNNRESCLSFKSPGENSFKIEAILENEVVMTSNEEYSEGGYKFIATVKSNQIEMKHADY